MKALGVDPDRISYTSVIAAVRNKPPIDWLLIEELLTEMAHRGITLDMVTANAAITAYLRAEQWSRVVSLLQSLPPRGVNKGLVEAVVCKLREARQDEHAAAVQALQQAWLAHTPSPDSSDRGD